MLYKKIILFVLIFFLGILNASAMNDEKESNKTNCKRYMHSGETKVTTETVEIQLLSPTFSIPIRGGIYKSDDIGLILSLPINRFSSQDHVIFDVDEVLITGYTPFYLEISKKYKNFYQEIFFRNKLVGDKLVLFMLSHVPWVFMDERLPALIEKLQLKEVKCIANTALDPLINEQLGLDLPNLRVKTLRNFNINFSKTFPELDTWNFDTLNSKHIKKDAPLFKEGIIFSAQTPKHITTNKLFKKLGIIPRTILYIDDSAENVKKMFKFFSSKGIDCYSIFYSKKENKPLKDFFEVELFNKKVREIENFFEKLLIEEKVEGLLQRVESNF